MCYAIHIRDVTECFINGSLGGLAPFDCSDTAGISARWERWLRAFELFADEKGVKHADQKEALMFSAVARGGAGGARAPPQFFS